MPAPAILAAIGRSLAGLFAGAGGVAASTGTRAAASGAARAAGAGAVRAGGARAVGRATTQAAPTFQSAARGARTSGFTARASSEAVEQASAAVAKRSAQGAASAAGSQAAGSVPPVVSRTAQQASQGAAQGAAQSAARAANTASQASARAANQASGNQTTFQRIQQLFSRNQSQQANASNQTNSAVNRLADIVTQFVNGGGSGESGQAPASGGGGQLPPGYGGGQGGGGGGFGGGSGSGGGGLGGFFGQGGGGGRRGRVPGLGELAGALKGNMTGHLKSAMTGDPMGQWKFMTELAMMPARLRDFGDSLIEAQKSIAGLGGEMMAASLKLRADRLRRDVNMADATGASFKGVTTQQSKLEDKLQKYQAAYTNTTNRFTQVTLWLTNAVVDVGERLGPLDEIANYLGGMDKKKEPPTPPLNKALQDIAKGLRNSRRFPPIGR